MTSLTSMIKQVCLNILLNMYLLKIQVYNQLFHQTFFTTKLTQISSLKMVLSQVYIL